MPVKIIACCLCAVLLSACGIKGPLQPRPRPASPPVQPQLQLSSPSALPELGTQTTGNHAFHSEPDSLPRHV